MKLIYQGFKIPPDIKKIAKSLAVASGVNFSEWIATAVQEKINRDTMSKGAEDEQKTNEVQKTI